MAIKPIEPVTAENIKSSAEKIKDEREKIQKSVEQAELDKPIKRHSRIDR